MEQNLQNRISEVDFAFLYSLKRKGTNREGPLLIPIDQGNAVAIEQTLHDDTSTIGHQNIQDRILNISVGAEVEHHQSQYDWTSLYIIIPHKHLCEDHCNDS